MGLMTPSCASSVTKPYIRALRSKDKVTLKLVIFEDTIPQQKLVITIYINLCKTELLVKSLPKKIIACDFIWSQTVKYESPETSVRELRINTSILSLFKSTNVQHLLKQSYYISTYREMTWLGKHTKTIFHHRAAARHYANPLRKKKLKRISRGFSDP